MKRFSLCVPILIGFGLAAAALASVESLTLRQMLQKADSAVIGSVTEKKTWEGSIAGSNSPWEFTTITVEGEDLFTGKTLKREITWLGSDAHPVSEMPLEAETRVGTKAIFFSVAMSGEFGGRQNQNSLIAAQNGVFRLEAGPKGDVVIGKGAGAAIENNTFVADLRKDVADTLVKIREKK